MRTQGWTFSLSHGRHGCNMVRADRPELAGDVWADTSVKCLELPLDAFADYRRLRPQIAMKIMRNLSALLARRLILANAKVDLFSAYRLAASSSREPRRSRLAGGGRRVHPRPR